MEKDRVFLLSPSFFALISGTLLSILIDLFKSLFFIQERQIYLVFSIVTLIISFGCFLYISLELEQLREKTALSDLLEKIRVATPLRRKLWLTFLVGVICLVLALVSMALGYIVLKYEGAMGC